MGILDIGDALDRFDEYAIEVCSPPDNPRRKKQSSERDPYTMKGYELAKYANLNLADEKTRMEEVIEFAQYIGNARMCRKLINRATQGVYEYQDILEDFGYTEDDVEDYFKL